METLDHGRVGVPEPLVAARDATLSRGGYRSYEFASFEALAGEVVALVSSAPAPARDLALSVAGLVEPTGGSLSVCGTELARRAAGRPRLARPRPSAGSVGMGVVSGVAGLDPSLTVEGALRRECPPAVRSDVDAVLGMLARFGLATRVGQAIDRLLPAERARLSAALAFCTAPRVAVVDLTDGFSRGASSEELAGIVAELGRISAEEGAACVVATTEPAAAASAASAFPLDAAAAEALASARGGDAR